MSHQPIPAGCRDAKAAAKQLGLTNKALLNAMRAMGWLINAPGTQRHNLPRREYELRGWLTTQDRGYRLKTKPEIVRIYRVTIITKSGFRVLENIMQSETLNNAASAGNKNNTSPAANECQFTQEISKTETEKEREKCLQQLREWGLAS